MVMVATMATAAIMVVVVMSAGIMGVAMMEAMAMISCRVTT
jgi:hypothetical protein